MHSSKEALRNFCKRFHAEIVPANHLWLKEIAKKNPDYLKSVEGNFRYWINWYNEKYTRNQDQRINDLDYNELSNIFLKNYLK